MAFFKNFQQNLSLPSMSSLVDTLSNAVDDLTSAVGDVSYTVADSVTEQVTSMINSLRTDDTATAQEDKYVADKEENRIPLNHDTEKTIRGKGCDAEEKHRQTGYLKQSTNDGREFHHNREKMANQLNAVEPNAHLNDAEVCEGVNNSIKHAKLKRPTEREGLKNVTFPKDTRQNCNTYRPDESFNKEPNQELHAVLEQSEGPLHKKAKQRSPGVDFKNAKEVHSLASRNSEKNEVQTPKLQKLKSKKAHEVHEVKEKKCKPFSDGHRQSVTKQEENAPSILSKESEKEKTKKSERFSKEVSSKKTPEKDNSYINKDQHGSSSESEDEALGKYHEALSRTQSSRPPAGDNRQQKNYIWETRQKYSPLSAEYDGYSSEASIDEGKHNEGRS